MTTKTPTQTATIEDLARQYLKNASEIRRLEKEKKNMSEQLDAFLGGQDSAEVQITDDLRVCRTVSYSDHLDPEKVRQLAPDVAAACTSPKRRTSIAVRLA